MFPAVGAALGSQHSVTGGGGGDLKDHNILNFSHYFKYFFKNSGNFWVPIVRVTNHNTDNIHTYLLLLLTLRTKQYLSRNCTNPVHFLYPFPVFAFSSALRIVDFRAEFQCQPENMTHTRRTNTIEIKILVCDKWVLVSNKKQEKTIAKKVNGSIQFTDTVFFIIVQKARRNGVLLFEPVLHKKEEVFSHLCTKPWWPENGRNAKASHFICINVYTLTCRSVYLV
jgi:hypothetical protein